MILSFTSFKGGVGKSTLAQNTAVALLYQGHSVAIIDADSTGSTFSWSQVREQNKIQTFEYSEEKGIAEAIQKLNAQVDYLIIDCPPAIEKITTIVLLSSDVAIVPIMASGSDIWTTQKFLEHLNKVRGKAKKNLDVKLVVNAFKANRNFDKDFYTTIQEYGNAYDIKILETTIGDRVVFKEANANGEGVTEYNDVKASNEIQSLLGEIIQHQNV